MLRFRGLNCLLAGLAFSLLGSEVDARPRGRCPAPRSAAVRPAAPSRVYRSRWDTTPGAMRVVRGPIVVGETVVGGPWESEWPTTMVSTPEGFGPQIGSGGMPDSTWPTDAVITPGSVVTPGSTVTPGPIFSQPVGVPTVPGSAVVPPPPAPAAPAASVPATPATPTSPATPAVKTVVPPPAAPPAAAVKPAATPAPAATAVEELPPAPVTTTEAAPSVDKPVETVEPQVETVTEANSEELTDESTELGDDKNAPPAVGDAGDDSAPIEPAMEDDDAAVEPAPLSDESEEVMEERVDEDAPAPGDSEESVSEDGIGEKSEAAADDVETAIDDATEEPRAE